MLTHVRHPAPEPSISDPPPASFDGPRRGCDVCTSTKRRLIYEQRFVSFDGGWGLSGYDVVVCGDCSFVYADGLPELSVFERYYREMSKYDPDADDRPLPPYRRYNHELFTSELVKRLPNRVAPILDVGSASGELLCVLRENGYTNLTGLDPSPRCAEAAMRRHQLRILTAPISQMKSSTEQFGLILLGGVLEHVRDLQTMLLALKTLLATDGIFCVAVPDANRFADYVESPYQHLSIEHINFFTIRSLESLFAASGMRLVDSWETIHLLGAMREPTINAIFSSSKLPVTHVPDTTGVERFTRYLGRSQCLQDSVSSKVAGLVATGEPVIIWGAGSLTMHLLSAKPFSDLNIVAFTDANENYSRKSIRGIPVLNPASLSQYPETILVSSFSYEAEICAQIHEVYKLPNMIVKMFGGDHG